MKFWLAILFYGRGAEFYYELDINYQMGKQIEKTFRSV
jgi:hypothetical protein